MRAIKGVFDGEKILLPPEVCGTSPGEVIVVFPDGVAPVGDAAVWLKAQEVSFAKAWDNDEDAVYDSM